MRQRIVEDTGLRLTAVHLLTLALKQHLPLLQIEVGLMNTVDLFLKELILHVTLNRLDLQLAQQSVITEQALTLHHTGVSQQWAGLQQRGVLDAWLLQDIQFLCLGLLELKSQTFDLL